MFSIFDFRLDFTIFIYSDLKYVYYFCCFNCLYFFLNIFNKKKTMHNSWNVENHNASLGSILFKFVFIGKYYIIKKSVSF